MKRKLLIPDEEVFECLNKMNFIEHNLVLNGQSTFDSFHTINENEVLKLIVNAFIDMAGPKYRLLEIWANRYGRGGYVSEHNHKSPILESMNVDGKAGVYFFKKPKMSGDFVLDGKKQNVEEGDMLLFNSDKNHYSLPNESDEERIIFSINIAKGVEKIWNNNHWEFRKV